MSEDKKVSENVENTLDKAESEVEQAVNFAEEFAKNEENSTASQADQKEVNVENKTEEKQVIVQKSGGKGIAFLALLVALAVGGAGHYMANKKFTEVEQQIASIAKKATDASGNVVEIPSFDAEKAQIAELNTSYQKALERINQLEQAQATYVNQVNGLQAQLQKVTGLNQSESTTWKLSDADFLLNNALRKLVLDNDIDTTKSLLLEADSVLAQISNRQVAAVRDAIKADLNQLASVNNVDQNSLMQRLTTLANNLDDLPMVADENVDEPAMKSGEVSDSITDWQQNIEKSASSFLDHFIRISDRNKADEKAFVAPNQEVYLRENIRLRLQIAILAIPRQQNELYKQSLEAVSSWIRSYFDTQNDNVKNFLKELDDLAEQSVYIDAPESLKSLSALDHLLNKAPQAVEKIEIKAETDLAQPTKSETDKADAEKAETTPEAKAAPATDAQPQAEQPAPTEQPAQAK